MHIPFDRGKDNCSVIVGLRKYVQTDKYWNNEMFLCCKFYFDCWS